MDKKWWYIGSLSIFSILIVFAVCVRKHSQKNDVDNVKTISTEANDSSETGEVVLDEEISDNVMGLIDFVIDVETGKNPVVLHLTDPQIIDSAQVRYETRLAENAKKYWATDKIEERCYSYIREVITKIQPDFIILTGDIVYGEFDDNGTALESFIAFMENFQIPWAPVFGNHDNESNKGVDWQCQQFENAEYCLFKQRDLTGNGNYTVGIRQDDTIKRVFFMLDSNGCGNASKESIANGHTRIVEGFGNDQIEWYTKTAQTIKKCSKGTKISFAFHIQLTVFADAFAKYGFVNNETMRAVNIDEHPDRQEGDFGYLGKVLKSPWDADYAVWKGLKKLGVDSIFVGHEHCNSASVVYEGVRCQYGQKISTYDRANFIGIDGRIVGTYFGDITGTRKAIMGGTVIPLSAKTGEITKPYIYLCGDQN